MYLAINSDGFGHLQDITDLIEAQLQSGLNGLINLFALGSTSSIIIGKFEAGINNDLKNFLARLIPADVTYQHQAKTSDDNGWSHLRANLFGPSKNIPVEDGKLQISKTQSIIFIDFDNRKSVRKILITFVPSHSI